MIRGEGTTETREDLGVDCGLGNGLVIDCWLISFGGGFDWDVMVLCCFCGV